MVLGSLNLQVVGAVQHERDCYIYKAAKWDKLRKTLSETDWSYISRNDPSIAAELFTCTVLKLCKKFIPYRKMQFSKQSHPWLNDSCRQSVAEKRLAHGRHDYAEKQNQCSTVLRQAYFQHIERTKVKIQELPHCSKKWWMLVNTLQLKGTINSSVPPLKQNDGNWAITPKEKANLLSRTFTEKCVLPAEEVNDYSEIASK